MLVSRVETRRAGAGPILLCKDEFPRALLANLPPVLATLIKIVRGRYCGVVWSCSA